MRPELQGAARCDIALLQPPRFHLDAYTQIPTAPEFATVHTHLRILLEPAYLRVARESKQQLFELWPEDEVGGVICQKGHVRAHQVVYQVALGRELLLQVLPVSPALVRRMVLHFSA